MPRYRMRASHGSPAVSGADAANDPLFVDSVARTIKLLNAFNDADGPLSLNELANRSGLNKSVAQRIVHTLKLLGYIDRDRANRGYIPGVRILDNSLDFLRMNETVRRATPILLELHRSVQERVDLSLLDGLRLVYAARLQSKREILAATLVGLSVPIYATAGGRAVMAHMSDEEVCAILRASNRQSYTEHTIVSEDGIREDVRTTRQKGYSLTTDQIIVGEIALGIALLGPDKRPLGAIHVIGSRSEWSPESFEAKVAPLAAQAATVLNGY